MAEQMGVGPGWPPHEMTEAEAAAVVPLTPQFQDLLRLRKVHYATWGALALSGIVEVEDFAALFASDALVISLCIGCNIGSLTASLRGVARSCKT